MRSGDDLKQPFSVWKVINVNAGGCKTVNVYKSPPIRLQVSDLPVFLDSCLYAGKFDCQHVNWGYFANSADGECLVGWVNINNLALL